MRAILLVGATIGAAIFYFANGNLWSLMPLAVLSALTGLQLISSALVVYSTELAVTDRRVIYKSGLIQRHTMEQQLERVDSVSIDQSILGRVLNYGEVEIRGSGNSFTPTHQIARPLEFRKAVQYAIDQSMNHDNQKRRI